jgi:hypothetical protein
MIKSIAIGTVIGNLITGAVIGAGIFAMADYAMSIPDVMVSYETNMCKQVQNYDSVLFGTTEYSCENMPTKFNHIWVQ